MKLLLWYNVIHDGWECIEVNSFEEAFQKLWLEKSAIFFGNKDEKDIQKSMKDLQLRGQSVYRKALIFITSGPLSADQVKEEQNEELLDE